MASKGVRVGQGASSEPPNSPPTHCDPARRAAASGPVPRQVPTLAALAASVHAVGLAREAGYSSVSEWVDAQAALLHARTLESVPCGGVLPTIAQQQLFAQQQLQQWEYQAALDDEE